MTMNEVWEFLIWMYIFSHRGVVMVNTVVLMELVTLEDGVKIILMEKAAWNTPMATVMMATGSKTLLV